MWLVWEWARVCDGSRGPVWSEIRDWAAENPVLSKAVLEGQAPDQCWLIELSAMVEVFCYFQCVVQ